MRSSNWRFGKSVAIYRIINGVYASIQAQAQRDVTAEEEIGKWIEAVTGENLSKPRDLIESLKSGILLCK